MRQVRGGAAGGSLVEVLVSVQLVALVTVMAWPVHRLVTSATEAGGGSPSSLRVRAVRYVQAELEYLRSLGYLRFRDPVRCAADGPVPFPAVRVLPQEAEPGEPELPPPVQRAEVWIADEPAAGAAPGGCGLRRVSVVAYGRDPERPVARGELLRAPR